MIHVESKFGPGIVAVPSGATARYNQFWDALEMLEVPKGTAFLHAKGTANIGRNRNDMIRGMLSMGELVYEKVLLSGELLKAKPSWMFFLDDDAEFEPGILLHMLERINVYYNVVAIGSLYLKKEPPFEPVVYKVITPKLERFTWREIALGAAAGPELPVAGCGASGLLVKRETLEIIGEAGDADARWFPENELAEDLGFCRKIYETGGSVYVQTKFPLGHTEPMTVTPEFLEDGWYVNLNWGGKGFRIPASSFHP